MTLACIRLIALALTLGQPVVARAQALFDTLLILDLPDESNVVDIWRAAPDTIFDASGLELSDFRFVARPVVIFADSPADPLFAEQMQLLLSRIDDLRLRDVVLIVDTDPSARTAIRQELRPRGFGLVLVSKEGDVELRKPAPWNVRELTRSIDKMPLRQQEIRDGG